MQERLEAAKEKAVRFEKLRQRLDRFTVADVSSALKLYESIVEDISRTSAYSYMRYSADTADQKAKAAIDTAEDLRAEVDNRVLFFRLWWAGLEDSETTDLIPASTDYRYVLGLWRKLKPYTLEEKVEQAVNLKNVTGFSGWTHHYDKMVSDFSFTLKVRGRMLKDAAGKPKWMVVDEVARLFASPDPATREAAYKTLLGRYAESGDVLGEVYRTIVRDWRNENVKMRGYATAISPRNLENDVPDAAVETLLKACRANSQVFQDFFRLKARMLGMKRMSRYHIYSPLAKKEKRVAYPDAVRTVFDAFGEFDAGFARMTKRVFDQDHVDASPRKGKRNGAYCMSVTPEIVPYLFLNYAGATRDVYTIAHESGHAVHSQLAAGHSILTFQPPLVLAETASVFGEMILFDKFMREEKDAGLKRAVLLEKISSMYATIGRQAYFVVFENQAHKAVSEGSTVSDLCNVYSSVLKEQFGDVVKVPEEFRWEWTYIPHIYHTPFYCYAYAFGNLLSLALYDAYLKEGRSFVPKYLRVLSYGGSESPGKILDQVGIDITSAGFWQSGFDVIRRMVDELQKL
jgi:oligoendopeptidase F